MTNDPLIPVFIQEYLTRPIFQQKMCASAYILKLIDAPQPKPNLGFRLHSQRVKIETRNGLADWPAENTQRHAVKFYDAFGNERSGALSRRPTNFTTVCHPQGQGTASSIVPSVAPMNRSHAGHLNRRAVFDS